MKLAILGLASLLMLPFCAVWPQALSETSPEAAPGILLPARGGIYVLDSNPDKRLIRLQASEVLLNRHTGSNLAKSMFYVGSRQTLDLSGTEPKVAVHSDDISIFYYLNPDQSSLDLSRLTLVKLELNGDRRIVAALDMNVFGGGAKRKVQIVEIQKQELQGGEWVKIAPKEKLQPGDYAIALFPKDAKLFPDSAFDFRVVLASQR